MNGMHSKRKIREKYPQLDGHLSELYTGKTSILAFEINFINYYICNLGSFIDREQSRNKSIQERSEKNFDLKVFWNKSYIFKSLQRPFSTKFIMMISSIKPISVSFSQI